MAAIEPQIGTATRVTDPEISQRERLQARQLEFLVSMATGWIDSPTTLGLWLECILSLCGA